MIGDLILWIKRVWKQQTCIHHYKAHVTKDLCQKIYFECEKCEKWQNNI